MQKSMYNIEKSFDHNAEVISPAILEEFKLLWVKEELGESLLMN